jgi:hypothetical protein
MVPLETSEPHKQKSSGPLKMRVWHNEFAPRVEELHSLYPDWGPLSTGYGYTWYGKAEYGYVRVERMGVPDPPATAPRAASVGWGAGVIVGSWAARTRPTKAVVAKKSEWDRNMAGCCCWWWMVDVYEKKNHP